MIVLSEGLYVQGMLNRIQADMPNAPEGLSKLVVEVTRAFVDSQISEKTATRLLEEIDARRKRQSNASDAHSRVGFHITAPVATTKPVSAPKVVTPKSAFQAADRMHRKTRLIRRRYLARVASMPAVVAQQFTIAEQAVLSQVAVRCRDHGRCDLSVSSLSKELSKNGWHSAVSAGAGVARKTTWFATNLIVFRIKRGDTVARAVKTNVPQ